MLPLLGSLLSNVPNIPFASVLNVIIRSVIVKRSYPPFAFQLLDTILTYESVVNVSSVKTTSASITVARRSESFCSHEFLRG